MPTTTPKTVATLDEAHERMIDAPVKVDPTPKVKPPVIIITRYAIRRDGHGADVTSLVKYADGSVGRQTQQVKDPANLRARLSAAVAEGKFESVQVSKGESYTNQQGELMSTSPAYWMGIHEGQAARNIEALDKVDTEDFNLEADPLQTRSLDNCDLIANDADVPADDKADSSDAS